MSDPAKIEILPFANSTHLSTAKAYIDVSVPMEELKKILSTGNPCKLSDGRKVALSFESGNVFRLVRPVDGKKHLFVTSYDLCIMGLKTFHGENQTFEDLWLDEYRSLCVECELQHW